MDDEDFEALIVLVERRLIEAGAAELADAALYMRRDPKTGERVVMPPQRRLLEMLAAFERHMKVRDISTYEAGLRRINGHLREGLVKGAVVPPAPGERRDEPVRLAMTPTLTEPRQRLDKLIRALREATRPSGARF